MNRNLVYSSLNRPVRQTIVSPALPMVIGLMVGVLSTGFGLFWLSSIGVGAFVYFLLRLIFEAGNDVPIESFILVTASMQWILGPVLTYAGMSEHFKYYMYVQEEQYMSLAVPGVLALAFGLYTFRPRTRSKFVGYYIEITQSIVGRSVYLPYYLIGVGFIFSFVVEHVPPALEFPVHILANVKYIGLIYLMFSPGQQFKVPILILAFVFTLSSSLRGAMFHDLLLWAAFIGMYTALIYRPRNFQKFLAIGLGLVFIFVLQASKDLYREKLNEHPPGFFFSKFIQSIDERLEEDEEIQRGNVERFVVRINQGWIVSRLMQVVPASVPHANGETVKTAIKASLLPRLLYPDKPKAGGRVNYEKYTGFFLQSGTSMGISLLGEAYINYGVSGAWIFMFVFGLISSFVIRQFFMLAMKYPTIWLWFPLILLHFVKAETELLVQLNFLVKSIFMVYLFVWANKYVLHLRI